MWRRERAHSTWHVRFLLGSAEMDGGQQAARKLGNAARRIVSAYPKEISGMKTKTTKLEKTTRTSGE